MTARNMVPPMPAKTGSRRLSRDAFRMETSATYLRGQNNMKTTTHTPGPWKVSFNGNDDVLVFAESVSDSPRCVAKLNMALHRHLECSANARLIAGAPDLLAALQAIELRLTQARLASNIGKESSVKKADFLRRQCEVIAQDARAAIAKATEGGE